MKKPTLQQRLKAKRRSQAMIVGLTWYTAETWAQIRATAIDPDCFETSFEKWKTMAVKARCEFQRSGVRALECRIVPEEFFAWCTQHSQENNATSRAEFVSEKLTATYEGSA
ncbi:MAG: hypothetical protein PHY62_10420 [Gallionella sp.]|nr:hypothetical protein [Gallionella sp.]